jgi:hypothetical protein
MIIKSFSVGQYSFVDRLLIDSGGEQSAVNSAIHAQLASAQQDAMCGALGVAELKPIPNFGFGVYDGATRIGVYLVASNDYISGPWADVTDWEVIGSDPIVLHGRHMPGFGGLPEGDEQALAADTTHYLLSEQLETVEGNNIAFSRLSWAIFKDRTDANSLRDIGIHNAIVADGRLSATQTPCENDATMTAVNVELA